jgi:hypothetical protein
VKIVKICLITATGILALIKTLDQTPIRNREELIPQWAQLMRITIFAKFAVQVGYTKQDQWGWAGYSTFFIFIYIAATFKEIK